MKTLIPSGVVFLAVFSVFVFNRTAIAATHTKNELRIASKNNLPTIPPPQEAPSISTEGDTSYCPLSSVNIVTAVRITDPSKNGISNVYIQISTDYVENQDLLILKNAASHVSISSSWNAVEGKISLQSKTANPIPAIEFEKAIKDIQFTNTSANVSGSRTFSISLGKANFLARNGHYYLYVADLNIWWTEAKRKAEESRYFGLQGYLATLTNRDEAILAGEQVPGTGWIGASDQETEGSWKWVTGPEAGTVFWYGLANGNSPNFAYWNNGEPNNALNEDYAHITSPGLGIRGSWNDLKVIGGTPDGPGHYVPQGYVVEFGGMPGDPKINISSSTKLRVAKLQSVTGASRCAEGSLTLKAEANSGSISWYDSPKAGLLLGTGAEFTTPIINQSTIYYASVCPDQRREVEALLIPRPTVLSANSPSLRCGEGSLILEALPSSGTINWYKDPNKPIIGTGRHFSTPSLRERTIYYAEAIDRACQSQTKVPIEILIYPQQINWIENINSCPNTSTTLDAGIPLQGYIWNTGERSQSINAVKAGIYKVKIISTPEQNCSSSKTINLQHYELPKIKAIKIKNNSIEIELLSYQKYYEFSIDQINYKPSNKFTNLITGKYRATVRDSQGCNSSSLDFVIITAAPFFSPNNDGINDLWELTELSNYPKSKLSIFDRYGKLIIKLDPNNTSWDGTYNNRPLLETDYWYILKLDEQLPLQKGHFSLER